MLVRVRLLVVGRVRRPLSVERVLVLPVTAPELAADEPPAEISLLDGLYTRSSLVLLIRSRGRSARSTVRPSEARVRSVPRTLAVEEALVAFDSRLTPVTPSARVLPDRSSLAPSAIARLRLKEIGSGSVRVARVSDLGSRELSPPLETSRRPSTGKEV